MTINLLNHVAANRSRVADYLKSRIYENQNPILEDSISNVRIYRIDENTTIAASERGYTVYVECDGFIKNAIRRAAITLTVKSILDENLKTFPNVDLNGKDIAFVYNVDKRYSFFQYYNHENQLTDNGPAVEILSRYALYTKLD